MTKTLHELLVQQVNFDKNYHGHLPFYTEINENNLSDLEHLIVCMIGEIGEFANILKKVRRGDFELESVKAKLDEELVDVFIYLLKISSQFNVDLETGYQSKMLKNTAKFERFKK